MRKSKPGRSTFSHKNIAISSCEIDLDKIKAGPKFIEMMEPSAADIRAGRVFSHEYVKRLIRTKRGSVRTPV
jgi:hypothetical protein